MCGLYLPFVEYKLGNNIKCWHVIFPYSDKLTITAMLCFCIAGRKQKKKKNSDPVFPDVVVYAF